MRITKYIQRIISLRGLRGWQSRSWRSHRPAPALNSLTWMWLAVFAAGMAPNAWGQLPEGPGKQETEKLCTQCHDLAKSVSLRQDSNGWGTTMNKMVAFGLKGEDAELVAVRDYLAKNFPAEALPQINVNKAPAIQLESRLSLKRSEASAIIRYRGEHGDFKSIEDLKKVPGVDVAKIEAKKDSLTFE